MTAQAMVRGWAAALAFLASTALPVSAQTQTLTLRYGQAFSVATSIFSLPIAVADREGLFKREGLDLRIIIPIPGGSDKMIEALHNDLVDITHVATPYLVSSALAGSDAVAIAAEFNNPIYSLVARPEIRTYADLKGKLVGLADERGNITLSIRKLLAGHGVRPGDTPVKIIEGTGARLACLKRGECMAVPLGQPQDLQAQSDGYRLLGLSTEAVPELLYTVTAVRRSWAETHKDALTRYVRALADAFGIIRDPARRESVIATIAATTGASPEIGRRTLALFFEPERRVLPMQAEIDLPGLTQMISLMAEADLVKAPLPPAERFVDLQYLRAAGIASP